MAENNNSTAQCIGRFQFSMSESFTVTRRSQVIYRVDVNTIPLLSGGFQDLWQNQLASIRARSSHQAANPIVKTFELQPGMSAAWFIGDPDSPHLRNLEVLKPVGNHVVRADAVADAGRESLAETLVTNILNSYEPTTSHGFCVGYGSISLEPAQIEKADVEITHGKFADLTLRFETETVKEPDTDTHWNVVEEQLAIAAKGGHLSVLRDHERTVAGLTGKEIRISVVAPGEPPFVRFTWHFPGAPIDSVKPTIDITGTALTKQQAELESAWESILQSLRPIPLSPKHP